MKASLQSPLATPSPPTSSPKYQCPLGIGTPVAMLPTKAQFLSNHSENSLFITELWALSYQSPIVALHDTEGGNKEVKLFFLRAEK